MEQSDFKIRIFILEILCVIIFIAVGVRFYIVQIKRHSELYGKAKAVYTKVNKKNGTRGEIYDVNGSLIAGNIPCFDIIADPSIAGNNKKCEEISKIFFEVLNIPTGRIFQKLAIKERNGRKLRYAMLLKNVDLNKSTELRKKINEKKLKGIFFKEKTKRYYPKGSLLAQTIGFVNIDKDKIIPVSGIERATNIEVMPEKGKIKSERDRLGRTLSYGYVEIDESKNGKNVYLTIDEQIQIFVENELDKLCSKFKPRAAYAIMVNPRNGNIIAMAQRPTFNPNDRSTMTPDAWRNRMITDVFEPGSTMKPVVIGSALDYNIVTPHQKFNCENGYWRAMRLRDAHRIKKASVTHILAESSNIGTAKIAIKMGKNLLYKTFVRFGFGSKSGILLKNEALGILRKPAKWDYLSISRFPIGQGIAVSPMQLVRAYCGLASGNLVYLRLIDRIQDVETGEIQRQPYRPASPVFRNSNARDELIEMMKLVTMQGGTAKQAAIPGYEVAGKTGTSQKWISTDKKLGIRGHYSEKKFFATFIGFVPADNPAFVLAVIADEPKGSHYGGVVSAPTFREIARKTLSYLNIAPKNPEQAETPTLDDF
jgi:cell division protein FtsI/penicillin-binding protein 2